METRTMNDVPDPDSLTIDRYPACEFCDRPCWVINASYPHEIRDWVDEHMSESAAIAYRQC